MRPKPVKLLADALALRHETDFHTLDFFAGSGTTGHAVLNLNREDGGQRKFILVEMGEYFDSVLLPRIAKVMTAPEWKDGKPKDTVEHIANGSDEHWSARTLPVVKVLELEGYEDSLDAIRFDQEAELFGGHDATTIRYVLDDAAGAGMRPQPVRVDTLSFDRPFDYRLPGKNVAEVGLPVDLAETACLMLGLAPVRLREAVRTVGTGANAKAFRFRFIEGRLMQSHDDIALLILRERDDASDAVAARAEGEWAAAQVQALFGRALGGYTKVFVNRDMVFTTPVPLVSMDAELKRVMLMRADH
jgi:adenine-specific DNA-methyltransferase